MPMAVRLVRRSVGRSETWQPRSLRWPHVLGRAGTGLRGSAIFTLYRIVDLLAVHRDRLRRLDAEANFVAANVNNRHNHVVTNHDAFVAVSGKDEHNVLGLIFQGGESVGPNWLES